MLIMLITASTAFSAQSVGSALGQICNLLYEEDTDSVNMERGLDVHTGTEKC
jgi:hypothetical protein